MLRHPLEMPLKRFHQGHSYCGAWWEFSLQSAWQRVFLTHQPLPRSPLGGCGDSHTSCFKEVMTSQNAIKRESSFPFYITNRVWKPSRDHRVKRRRSCCFIAWHLSIRSLGAEGLRANGLGINNRFGRIRDRSESGHSASG